MSNKKETNSQSRDMVATIQGVAKSIMEMDPTAEITARDDWRKVATVHGVAQEIMKLDPKAEDYEFRLQAKLKRLVHFEKSELYHRMSLYFDELSKPNKEFLQSKIETHDKMSSLPDEEIITWNVGPHKYVPILNKNMVNIFINGDKVKYYSSKDSIDYETILDIAGYDKDENGEYPVISVTYETSKKNENYREGSLTKGWSAVIEEGMIFSAIDTSKA